MTPRVLIVAPIVFAIAIAGSGVLDGSRPDVPPPDPTAGLTLRQLAGQRIVYAYAGKHPPRRLVSRVRRGEAAGVILFTRNIGRRTALRADMSRLQRAARASGIEQPLLVMIDQEGGLVKRLPGAPSHSAGELGKIGSAKLALSQGAATARNLRSAGVNVDLAPVLDVGRAGSFQRRTQRSFGSDPQRVGTIGSAFASGLQDGNVAATLKHFPGIGYVRGDEDLDAQRVPLSRSRLRAVDEAPFSVSARAGADLVMTSTAVYPAFDDVPALLSPQLSNSELRDRLGFRGVSITDDIEVPALHRYGSPARLGLRAARAGNDLLLFAQHYASGERALGALTRAAGRENPGPGQMRTAARRVLELRSSLSPDK